MIDLRRGVLTAAAGLGLAALTAASLAAGSLSDSPPSAPHALHRTVIADELELGLRGVARAEGVAAALRQLDLVASRDRTIALRGHELAHSIGEASLDGGHALREVLGDCRPTFLYGCYHGAVRAYFASPTQLGRSDVATICPADVDLLIHFQCVHGFGHGVFVAKGRDLQASLAVCDAMGSGYDRDACSGGSFMENILAAYETQEGARAVRGDGRPWLRPEDPHYPCNAVADRQRSACYQVHASALLFLNGRDHAKASLVCDTAPRAHRELCLEGLGREISTGALRDSTLVIATCSALPVREPVGCLFGGVRDLLDAPGRVLPFCRDVPVYAKARCYDGAGVQLGLHYPRGHAARTTICETAERPFVAICESARDRH